MKNKQFRKHEKLLLYHVGDMPFVPSLSHTQNYITSIDSNETNLASALGELLPQLLQCL